MESDNLENVTTEVKIETSSETDTEPRLEVENEIQEDDVDFKSKLDSSFKVPLMIGPRSNKPKNSSSSEVKLDVDDLNSQNGSRKLGKVTNKTPKELPAFPYIEPGWAGTPNQPYNFEVIKTGIILSNIDLSSRSYTTFGRLDNCHVVLEHPSVSRYHAVLQYRSASDEGSSPGFYIYDLGSTHGTFLNKQQIKPRIYYRMHVGHMLKIGGSTRLFILQGPEEDEEPESDLTVTEIKELAQKRELAKKLGLTLPGDEEPNNESDAGIDWGMGDDAVEEPIGENPFSLNPETTNEELYIADPKKTLRGWFEREGYELEYKIEEKGVAHFSCRIELPIDVAYCPTTYAEATVKGKKKEAVVACALEACRILDRNGLLRQSQHEARKRKPKKWEDEDFYDSDEDTFLDRTGTIEKKREMRKKMVKKDEVETFETLNQKLIGIDEEIAQIQEKLEKSEESLAQQKAEEEQDPLDAFMAGINNSSEIDKKSKSRLRLQLSILNQDRVRLSKLVELARPTSLPPLSIKSLDGSKKSKGSLLIGAMKGRSSLKNKTHSKTTSVSSTNSVKYNDEGFEVEEEEEEEEENDNVKTTEESKDKNKAESRVAISVENDSETQATASNDRTVEPKIFGAELPPLGSELPLQTKNPLGTSQGRRRNDRSNRRKKSEKVDYDSTNPDYAMWMPPEGQTGDGKTHLNDKFGY